MTSSWMLRRVALVRTDDSEEISASFIGVTRIGELGTTLDVTNKTEIIIVGYIRFNFIRYFMEYYTINLKSIYR
jgi:hypothetical protein